MSLISDIVIGNIISFKSKALNDNSTYYGQVVAFGTKDLAVGFAAGLSDIVTYNNNVQVADNNVPNYDLLDYMIIKLIEQLPDNPSKYLIAFAKEWVNEATLNIIATNKVALIKVYEVDSTNVQDVIDLLKSGGFKARVEDLK